MNLQGLSHLLQDPLEKLLERLRVEGFRGSGFRV